MHFLSISKSKARNHLPCPLLPLPPRLHILSNIYWESILCQNTSSVLQSQMAKYHYFHIFSFLTPKANQQLNFWTLLQIVSPILPCSSIYYCWFNINSYSNSTTTTTKTYNTDSAYYGVGFALCFFCKSTHLFFTKFWEIWLWIYDGTLFL